MTAVPPNLPPSYDQALRLHLAGRRDEAEALYKALVQADPKHSRAWFGLGVVAAQKNRPGDAIVHFERAIALGGVSAAHHHNLATAKGSVGRFAEAETHFREALRLKPTYYEAYFNFSESRSFRDDGRPWAEAVETCLRADGLTGQDKRFLHFAAGKLWHDLGEHDRAWPHYVAGNAVRGAQFDQDWHNRIFSRTELAFGSETMSRKAGIGHAQQGFVFIVGMPRSGTTLAEQIIASHPQAYGAGELNDIHGIARELGRQTGQAYPDFAEALQQEHLNGYGQAYARRVGGKAPHKSVIVDKHPLNFRYVGLIRLLLPQARVIWARRDPLDTCLSCFQQNFRDGQEYSFSLDDVAFMYAWHERLMRHWQKVAGPVHVLDYADLVENPEATARALLDHVGLPWDPSVLAFHTTDRHVATASRWQVRQPLYRSSVGRAARYADHIAPLAEALQRRGVAVAPPAGKSRRHGGCP